MFISIQELEQHEVRFDEQFRPETIDLGAEIRQKTALKTAGQATLVRENRGKHAVVEDIRLVGDLATRVELRCARCLEPVQRDVAANFDLLFRPLGVDGGKAERSIGPGDAEIGYYSGEGILLEDVLREQIFLALPMRAVCREECKGLCSQCGQNLNQGQCACGAPPPDERWSALKEIRDKLDH